MHIESLAIHAGQKPDPSTGAVMTPIYQTSTFVQAGVGDHQGYEYARTGNPTRAALEACLAELEGAAHGLAFSSGMAAIDTILKLLDPGDHVLASNDVYGGTFRLFDKQYRKYGMDFSYAELTDLDAVKAHRARTAPAIHVDADRPRRIDDPDDGERDGRADLGLVVRVAPDW